MGEEAVTMFLLVMVLAFFYTWCIYKVGFRRGHRAGFRYGFLIAETRRDGYVWESSYVQGVEYRRRAEESSLQ